MITSTNTNTNTKGSPFRWAFLGALGGLLGLTGAAATVAGGAMVLGGAKLAKKHIVNPIRDKIRNRQGIFGPSKRKIEIRKANRELRKQKQSYLDMDITNPYKDLTNLYAGMENPAEDLVVNQQAAQFQAQQQAQQRANILQSLRGAAGTSGVAGLAQALSQQQATQTQAISASIAEQEATNERISAQMAFGLKRATAEAGMQVQQRRAYGEYLRETRDIAREETLLAGAYQRAAAAMGAQQTHQANVISSVSGVMGAGLQGYAMGQG